MFLAFKKPHTPNLYTEITGGIYFHDNTLTVVLLDTPTQSPENWQCVHMHSADITAIASTNLANHPRLVLDPDNLAGMQEQVLWHGCGTEVRTQSLILPAGATYDDIFSLAIMKIEEMPNHEQWRWELHRNDNEIDYDLFLTPREHINKMQRIMSQQSGYSLESWYPPQYLKALLPQAISIIARYGENLTTALSDSDHQGAITATAAIIAAHESHPDSDF